MSRRALTLCSLLALGCGSSGQVPDGFDEADGGAVDGDGEVVDLRGGGAVDLPGGGADGPTVDLAADLAPPKSSDPDHAGSRQVARFDLQVPLGGGLFSSLATTVYGPSDDGKSLAAQGAPFPTVIFSPGFMVDRNGYAYYAQRLASHGFVVVTQSYRNAGDHNGDVADTIALLTWLIKPTGPEAGKIAGKIDGFRVGLTGHSLGGKVSTLTASRDARVRAVFGIDPVDGAKPPFGQPQPSAITALAGYKGATGWLGETISAMGMLGQSCAPAGENYQKFYQASPAPSFAITFPGADHMDFLDDANCLLCGLCGQGKANPPDTHRLAMKYTTAFFRRHLLGDLAADDVLSGARFAADAATGAVTLEKK